MSGMNVLNCDCVVGASGDCSCDLTQMHLACGRHSLEVYPVLPETGVVGTTYFIGDNAQGYTEYVWNPDGGFVEMGTATATMLSRMTLDALGLGKLSTSNGLVFNTTGGAVGMNGEGQLLARVATNWDLGTVRLSTPTVLTTTIGEDNFDVVGGEVGLSESKQLVARAATLDRYGAVRLGSQWQRSNSGEYVVGIGVSNNPGLKGQLCFNLAEVQPLADGTGFSGETGALRYRINPNTSIAAGDVQYEMFVCTGSATQLGVVKMLNSLNGYTESEINAMRETHAASVGLVVDGLESFCEWFFTDSLMQGYFDTWASGKALGEEVWANHGTELAGNVFALTLASPEFSDMVDSSVSEKSEAWLVENITADYLDSLFSEKIETLINQYLTSDIVAIVESTSEATIKDNFQDELIECLSIPENVTSVANVVAEKSRDILSEAEDEILLAHIEDIISGTKEVEIGGEQMLFTDYIRNHIDVLVAEKLAEVSEKANLAYDRANATNPRAFVLSRNGDDYGFSTTNPMNDNDNNSHSITTGLAYTHTAILPPGKYQVRLSSAPRSPAQYHRSYMYRATMKDSNDSVVAESTYRWYGDTGKSNDEYTQGYYTGIGMVEVGETGRYTFSIEVTTDSGWNGAGCAYVMVEFV